MEASSNFYLYCNKLKTKIVDICVVLFKIFFRFQSSFELTLGYQKNHSLTGGKICILIHEE